MLGEPDLPDPVPARRNGYRKVSVPHPARARPATARAAAVGHPMANGRPAGVLPLLPCVGMRLRTIPAGFAAAVLLSFTFGCATGKPYQVPGPDGYEFVVQGLTLELKRERSASPEDRQVWRLRLVGDQCAQDYPLEVHRENSSLWRNLSLRADYGDEENISVYDKTENVTRSVTVRHCYLMLRGGAGDPYTVTAEHRGAKIRLQFEEIDWPEVRWRGLDGVASKIPVI